MMMMMILLASAPEYYFLTLVFDSLDTALGFPSSSLEGLSWLCQWLDKYFKLLAGVV